MSQASESARVRIVLADYGVEQQGKMTLVGAGINIFGVNPDTGFTAPFVVWATVDFAPEFVDYTPAVELSLETDDGKPVQLPHAGGEQPQLRPVRVGNYQALALAALKGVDIPPGSIRPKAQIFLIFQIGINIDAGQSYRWRVEVDGVTHDDWTELMYILPPARG